jgi:NAD(P)-dependent dehydrogenase (short-subunit alcohol dehydrogenase family)
MSKNDISLPKFDLRGKWALVTGGAGLLGKEHAMALLQSGANVVLWDINNNKLSKTADELTKEFTSGTILAGVVDITDEKAVSNAHQKLESQGISVSILINNAAINPKYTFSNSNPSLSRVESLTLDDWNHQISVGLTGAFICSKSFGAKMAANKYGIILNIASDLSVISPDQRLYQIKGVVLTMFPTLGEPEQGIGNSS